MKAVTIFVFILVVATALAAPTVDPKDGQNRDGKFLGLFGLGLGLGYGYPYYGGYGYGYPYYGGYPYSYGYWG